MDREEIKKALGVLGVDYDGRWTTDKLFSLLQQAQEAQKDEVAAEPEMGVETSEYTNEQIENIAKAVSGQNTLTTEELVKETGLHKELGGEVKTRNGLFVPPQIMAGMSKSKFKHHVKITSDKADVFRRNPKGRDEWVRAYSVELHGDEWLSLAKMFVDKNNK